MKKILISIRPKWVEKIASGEKTIEVRKSAPKEVPFKCYIYMTQGTYKDLGLYSEGIYQNRMKVIGEFICDKVERFTVGSLRSDDIEKLACLSYNEMIFYFYKPAELDGKTAKQGFAWHISDLKIYDKPKALVEFYKCGAESFEELSDTEDLCSYCSRTGFCEGRWCDEAYQNYLDVDFALTRAPSNWCYVEEL